MRSNLLSLQNIAGRQNIVQNRLATGLKVSSAIDNPSSYYTASSLSNRAADLTALLDAMSQGIQTIKIASEAIDSGIKFLEQAKAVASQALESAVPAKKWFEEQVGVAAVVSNQDELLAAVNSGKKGNIVIYGEITLNGRLSLMEGQNLVGINYFGNFASADGKFSKLNFTLPDTDINNLSLRYNCTLSDLELTFQTKNGGNSISISENAEISLNNINITSDFSDVYDTRTTVIRNGKLNLSGEININCIGNKKNNSIGVFAIEDATEINIGSGGRLNINSQFYGIHGEEGNATQKCINLHGDAEINISSRNKAVYGCKYNLYDQSKIRATISSHDIIAQETVINVFDQGQIFLKENNANTAVAIWGFELNLNSSQARVVCDATTAFRSTLNNLTLSAVKGAVIETREGIFRADSDIKNISMTEAGIPPLMEKISSRPANADKEFANLFKEKTSDNFSVPDKSYYAILNQYNMLIADSFYKGINLLEGQNLKVNFNEDRSSKIDVAGVKVDSNSLGIVTEVWETSEDVEQSISELEAAINTLRGYASAFGNYYSIVTTRQDFTENLINVLEEGADKLTLADMNQEAANMLALQTSQQLAINSLSLASQAAQSVLKLF